MNSIDLLILDGPPAVGKSSLAKAISIDLAIRKIPHAIIELDELAKIYPRSAMSVMYKNLETIWPNYEALGALKIIIPTYMQAGEREIVMEAAPANRTTICEVVVPYDESVQRIVKREQNDESKQRHIAYLDGYRTNKTPDEHVDFKVLNSNRPIETVAQEIIDKLGWSASE